MSADPGERRLKEAQRALGVLEGAGHQARLAGGCVRDRLLGRLPTDYDVATTARPDDAMTAFRGAGFKTVPTGLAHGTVTVVMPSGPVEVTTLRTDLATDGRHATVAFGTSFEDDAARRDFTINAMFEDRLGVVYDFFGGQEDLTAGILRFVGDPTQRIHEDYLRLLRLFRFWARFGFAPADQTLVVVAATRDGLARISQERVTSEMLKTMTEPHARTALLAMEKAGVWRSIMPEMTAADAPALGLLPGEIWTALSEVMAEHRAYATLVALAQHSAPALIAAEPMRLLAVRLKMSASEGKRLALAGELRRMLTDFHSETAAALDLVDACEATMPGAFAGFFAPVARVLGVGDAMAYVEGQEAAFGFRRTMRVPLDGEMLQKRLGIGPGPELGRLLALARRGFRNGAYEAEADGLTWLDASRSVS